MRSKWFALMVVGGMAVLGALLYNRLPDQVPSHWNIQGEVDGYTNRFWGVTLLPLISLGVWLMLRVLPAVDPRRASYAEFTGTFQLFVNCLVLFFAVLYVVTLLAALGVALPVGKLVPAMVGILFAALGNEFGRVQPNFFVGVRTPWTLSDREVWRLTHRAAGRAMVVAGLLMLVGALLLPETLLFVVVMLAALGFALFSVAYSFAVWKRLHPSEQH